VLRVTTLCENTARIGDFLGEWGLSILVETDDAKVLLDAGKGPSAPYNADTLGIDLRSVDKIVLSHGHFDHTGGLAGVLRRMRKEVEVVAHPDVWQAKYSRGRDGSERFIGIPASRAELESLGARFVLATGPINIAPTITTLGEVPMVTDLEQVDSSLFVREATGLRPDPVLDDRGLAIKTPAGLVVVLGCAHRGLINSLYHAREITGESRVYAVIGGAHLMGTSDERLERTIAALKNLGIQKMGLCHCTDLPAAARLYHEFGDRFFFNRAGLSIEL